MSSSVILQWGRFFWAVGLGSALVVALAGGCAQRDPVGADDTGVGTGGGTGAPVTPGGAQCAADQLLCGELCVYPASNVSHCGGCSQACGAGQGCEASQCACLAPLGNCTEGCVDLTVSSANCGQCGTICGSGQSCTSSICTCSGGQTACDGVCVDTLADEANCGTCGTICPTGTSCGADGCQCQGTLTSCGSACVDTTSDGNNCGDCGVICPTGQVCSASTCATSCGTGLDMCGTSCVDFQSSLQHCGGCDHACAAGQECTGGACVCAGGELACGDACVNAQTDSSNCGTCGTICTGGQSCVVGVCSCPEGQESCNGSCVDVLGDPLHCGDCETACDGGRSCVNGACACPTAGDVYCAGTCMNVMGSDMSNCGACGEVCSGVSCDAGVCNGAALASCSDTTYSDAYAPGYTAARNPEVDSLLNTMSLTEKADQMRGMQIMNADGTAGNYDDTNRTPDVGDIRGYQFRDGPRGVNLEAPQPGRNGGEDYATAFPVSIAQGASFDLDLVYRVGEAQGDETVASRNTMLLAPCMNILRHPAWGRSQETFGEDTWHLGRIASAYTVGLQTHVAGCAKHYAGNNIEEDRFRLNAAMDEQTLREVYTRHFEMVVQEGGVACIMAAYNSVNGTKNTQNRHLLTDILKQDMGFRGFVITDWWAMPGEQSVTLQAGTAQSNARAALEAGLDMEMPWSLNYAQIEALVGSGAGQLSMDIINDAAGRILEQKFRFGCAHMTDPFGPRQTVTSLSSSGSIQGNDAHLTIAREAAVKSMVLLKNADNTLPISLGAGKTVAVLGGVAQYSIRYDDEGALKTVNFATEVRTGDRGSSRVKTNPSQTVSPLQGITAAAERRGVSVITGTSASEAASADFVVVVVGLTAQDEGEEYTLASDRTTFALDGKRSGNQNQLVEQAAALGKPMVVVLTGGSVIDMPWLSSVPAVVMAWYPGQRGGEAMGDLLFGDENFSGKLPITWGTWDQWPTFNEGTTTNMDYYVGYKRFDHLGLTPIYPFGHGLSYTTFEYGNLDVPCASASKNAVVEVKFDVTNTGTAPGNEVAFLFVSHPQTSRTTDGPGSRVPVKELLGFTRTPTIEPGETRRVTIPLRVADLKYWNLSSNAWEVESGPVTILVGSSSANLPLTGTATIE